MTNMDISGGGRRTYVCSRSSITPLLLVSVRGPFIKSFILCSSPAKLRLISQDGTCCIIYDMLRKRPTHGNWYMNMGTRLGCHMREQSFRRGFLPGLTCRLVVCGASAAVSLSKINLRQCLGPGILVLRLNHHPSPSSSAAVAG